jgi:F-type H+-transporting ATPase subunit gamma
MPTLKEYNAKISRLRSTRKMTRTMKMVSANKLRKAQEALRGAEDFGRRLQAMLATTGGCLPDAAHPLAEIRPAVRTVHCVVIASDRGLCGGFNNNLSRTVAAWVQERSASPARVDLSFCGHRGYLALRGLGNARANYEGLAARPGYGAVQRLGRALIAGFVSGTHDEVHLAYNRASGALAQTPQVERLLPLRVGEGAAEGPAPGSSHCLIEPGRQDVLDALLSSFAHWTLYRAFLNSLVAEHGARMAAMDNSTTNAERLIDEYTLRRNRARQAAITKELLEIIAGAEALR